MHGCIVEGGRARGGCLVLLVGKFSEGLKGCWKFYSKRAGIWQVGLLARLQAGSNYYLMHQLAAA